MDPDLLNTNKAHVASHGKSICLFKHQKAAAEMTLQKSHPWGAGAGVPTRLHVPRPALALQVKELSLPCSAVPRHVNAD